MPIIVHTPRIPRSSAIRTAAAFSLIAIAVLYVFAPTFSGAMLQSKRCIMLSKVLPSQSIAMHTCDLQILRSIHFQPGSTKPPSYPGFMALVPYKQYINSSSDASLMQLLCETDQLLRHHPWYKQCQGNHGELALQNSWLLPCGLLELGMCR